MSEVVLIAAVARNGIIGATVDGKPIMPWHLPEDLRHFKELTTGHAIVMGRRTWESLGRPLPNRHNIVITRQRAYAAPGATVVRSLNDALAVGADSPATFVIGGGDVYAQALARANRLELTEIDADYAGDTRFPDFSRSEFAEVARATHCSREGLRFAFVSYQRQSAAGA